MLLVVMFENILFLKEMEQRHSFVQEQINVLRLGHSFVTLLELIVDEKRQVLGRFQIQIKKVFEVGGDHLRENGIVCEGFD